MEGRIFDAVGKPLPGASVHLRSRLRLTTNQQAADERVVAFDGGYVLVTDADGRFRTPEELELDREYMLYAHAKGHQVYKTAWTPAQHRALQGLSLPADTPAR